MAAIEDAWPAMGKSPDLLTDGPRSVDELVSRARLVPDALHRVMRMLASEGDFSEVSPRVFRQTAVSDVLRIFRARRMYMRLPEMLQTGRSAFELTFGLPVWEYLDQNPHESTIF